MQKFRVGLAAVVTIVWLVGYVIAYLGGTQPPVELSGLFAVVLGWAFGSQVRVSIKRKTEGGDVDGDG